MTHGSESPPPSPLHKLGVLGILVWVSMIAVDFFLHAGILASLYAQPSPFLLPPEAAFARIPLGDLFCCPFALGLLALVPARAAGARARRGTPPAPPAASWRGESAIRSTRLPGAPGKPSAPFGRGKR